MKRTREQKGITLVALIITIVVLLILAVAGIGAVQESGIILHTQNAASDYNEAQGKENSAIQGYDSLINKYANPTSTSVSDLYWYEENKDGGITILGPKKLLIYDAESAENKALENLTTIYGAETVYAVFGLIESDIEVTEELVEEILMKFMVECEKTKYDFSNKAYWSEIDVDKSVINGANWVENLQSNPDRMEAALYNTGKLPESIDGKPVTQIGDYAFQNVWVMNGSFIPNTVKIIGEFAFKNSAFKTQLIIPDGVEEIKDQAFCDVKALYAIIDEDNQLGEKKTTLVFNSTKTNLKIGEAAFAESQLTGTITLSTAITIPENAFNSTEVVINRQ